MAVPSHHPGHLTWDQGCIWYFGRWEVHRSSPNHSQTRSFNRKSQNTSLLVIDLEYCTCTCTVRQVLKLTEPPECFARLIVLLLYHWAYGLVFLKAAAARVSKTKVVGLTQFIPWSCGSWKFGPMPEELAFQALESFKLVPNSAYSDSSLQAASLTILESCVAIYGLKI